MDSISSIKQELERLPKGGVYEKLINGSRYFYHQYTENGRRVSKLLKEAEVFPLLQGIDRRKELERELKRRSEVKTVVLSKSAREFDGDVYSGNRLVARFLKGEMVFIDEDRAPLILKRTGSIQAFLKSRLIDESRPHSRLLKKALHIQEEDTRVSLYAYASTLSDDYWFKPKHSKITYKDIRFASDAFADLSLKGEFVLVPKKGKLTPELTTGGSFEKGWKLIDDQWWLYKAGTKKEVFSEALCYLIAKYLGVPSAVYEVDGDYIRSLNFASNVNYEPMSSIAGNDEDYEVVYHLLYELNPDLAKEYLRLCIFDCLVNNVDRHNENCGILRDRRSGKILSLAPNFDDNLALLSRMDYLSGEPAQDGLIKGFVRFAYANPKAREQCRQISLPDIAEDDMKALLDQVPLHVEGQEGLPSALKRRMDYLKQKLGLA